MPTATRWEILKREMDEEHDYLEALYAERRANEEAALVAAIAAEDAALDASISEAVKAASVCDGSGYFEHYVDVDVTVAEACEGCAACDEQIAAQVAHDVEQHQLYLMHEAIPMWMGEDVSDARRRPTLPELPAGFKFITAVSEKEVA